MTELEVFREEINTIDRDLTDLLLSRLATCQEIGRYKIEAGLPVFNAEREQQVLDKVATRAGDAYGDNVREIYKTIMTESKKLQEAL